MEPAIRQYEIPPRQIIISWWKKLLAFFAVVFLLFGFRLGIDSVFHWKHESPALALVVPVALALSIIFRPFRWHPESHGSLIVGEDFIESRTETGWHTFKKRICRHRIRSISENRRGLTIMDRSEFASRMLGFVFIPATMPEYQEVRHRLLEWMPPTV